MELDDTHEREPLDVPDIRVLHPGAVPRAYSFIDSMSRSDWFLVSAISVAMLNLVIACQIEYEAYSPLVQTESEVLQMMILAWSPVHWIPSLTPPTRA